MSESSTPSSTSSSLRKTFSAPFAEVLARVPPALKAEGFGILTEIDVQETLRQKLGAELRPYRILGACNPPFAHQALQVDAAAGLMMPCNVVVFEGDDGQVTVAAVDPVASAQGTGNAALAGLAAEVRAKLERALASLG